MGEGSEGGMGVREGGDGRGVGEGEGVVQWGLGYDV